MKKLVTIVSVGDWAGSQYQVHKAINSVGEFECRHISMFNHPFEFPTDVYIPIYPNVMNQAIREVVRSIRFDGYKEASDLLQHSDLIHLWNTFPGEPGLMAAGLPIPFDRVKVVTMTGSLYRKNHEHINLQLSEMDNCSLTVQNPMLMFPDEIESTFIPHTVDTDALQPKEKRKKTIATYRPIQNDPEKATDDEIRQLNCVVEKYPDWNVDLDYSMSWKERMLRLAECSMAVQDIRPYIGYWGRSTLEACALGMPALQNYSNEIVSRSNGFLGDIPVVQVNPDNIEEQVVQLIQDENYRKHLGEKSRQWVKEYFSYPVIGKLYSNIYSDFL